jgi:hypothetical protein
MEDEGDVKPLGGEDAVLAPFVSLLERLRTHVADLQGRWEKLGEELEMEQGRLRLAEATWERLRLEHPSAETPEQRSGRCGEPCADSCGMQDPPPRAQQVRDRGPCS